MTKGHKITVVGTGYVGMSLAVLLAQHNEVTALDIDEARVELINQGKSTVVDKGIEHYLEERDLSLTSTLRVIRRGNARRVIKVVVPVHQKKRGRDRISEVPSSAAPLGTSGELLVSSEIALRYDETDRVIFGGSAASDSSMLREATRRRSEISRSSVARLASCWW